LLQILKKAITHQHQHAKSEPPKVDNFWSNTAAALNPLTNTQSFFGMFNNKGKDQMEQSLKTTDDIDFDKLELEYQMNNPTIARKFNTSTSYSVHHTIH